MNMEIDARGIACPLPVVNTKKALAEVKDGAVTVLVDSPESCENVKRFAESQGCRVEIVNKDGGFCLNIVKGQMAQAELKQSSDVLLITSDRLGTGDRRLGEILMKAFLDTLGEAEPKPAKIILINDGVRLATEGSEVLNALGRLEKNGVQIFSCGTCLGYYDLKEKLKVGQVTNMFDTVNSLLSSGKVIKV